MGKNSKVEISVIMPVYNTGRFLKRSIESILNQTFNLFEFIIVNDGSTDDSEKIIQEYIEKDNRIILINQINCGQSISRNNGLKIAKGKYIYFFDSDDILENNALEICYNIMEKNKIDFIFFDADSFISDQMNKPYEFSYSRSHLISEGCYSGNNIMYRLISNNVFFIPVWLIFIRKSFLNKEELHFYPGIIHEDVLYTFNLYLHSEDVYYLPKKLFHRNIRKDSTMTSKVGPKNTKGYFIVCEELIKKKRICNSQYYIFDEFIPIVYDALISTIVEQSYINKIKLYIHILFSKQMLQYFKIKYLKYLIPYRLRLFILKLKRPY